MTTCKQFEMPWGTAVTTRDDEIEYHEDTQSRVDTAGALCIEALEGPQRARCHVVYAPGYWTRVDTLFEAPEGASL